MKPADVSLYGADDEDYDDVEVRDINSKKLCSEEKNSPASESEEFPIESKSLGKSVLVDIPSFAEKTRLVCVPSYYFTTANAINFHITNILLEPKGSPFIFWKQLYELDISALKYQIRPSCCSLAVMFLVVKGIVLGFLTSAGLSDFFPIVMLAPFAPIGASVTLSIVAFFVLVETCCEPVVGTVAIMPVFDFGWVVSVLFVFIVFDDSTKSFMTTKNAEKALAKKSTSNVRRSTLCPSTNNNKLKDASPTRYQIVCFGPNPYCWHL
uniref:Uncharacterized protein n=1 Tax=Glossina pallidipes TaxID=7398 RepID=A0A1B0A3S8_GLOPL